jgi:acyl carrier protein
VAEDGPFSLLTRRNHERAPHQDHAVRQFFPEGTRDANGVLQADKVLAGLRCIVALLLGQQDATSIALDTPLADYGFDSLMAVEFRTQVSQALRMQVPLSITFEFPTLGRIGAWLCAQDAAQTTTPQAAKPVLSVSSVAEESQLVLRDIDALLGDDA